MNGPPDGLTDTESGQSKHKHSYIATILALRINKESMLQSSDMIVIIINFDHCVFVRPFVKRFDLCYRTVICPIVLSVTLVYCGQTVRWIKLPLGTEVGLGPGHIVLDGDHGWISFHGKGHSSPHLLPFTDTGKPASYKPWPMTIVAKRSPISAAASL